jgi:hypothetical protein
LEDLMADANTFLDMHVPGVMNDELVARLDLAEQFLRDRWKSEGSPDTLAGWCGVQSMTAFHPPRHVAIDINPDTNPYFVTRSEVGGHTVYGGELNHKTGFHLSPFEREDIARAADNAVRFTGGTDADLSIRRPGEPTAQVYDRFQAASNALTAYLGVLFRPDGPRRITRPRVPSPTGATLAELLTAIPETGLDAERRTEFEAVAALYALFVSGGLSPVIGSPVLSDDALRAWQRMLCDYELARTPMQFGQAGPILGPPPMVTRNPVRGFLNLRRELVMVLCDEWVAAPETPDVAVLGAHLKWGACDLGPDESGDMMHFQL